MDAIYTFVRHLRSVRFEDLPPEVIDATKKSFLDTLGVAVAGLSQKGPHEIWDVVRAWEMEGKSTVIGKKGKLPAPYAAQINATLIHALDYDDVHEKAIMHPSVITVPTVLALAEQVGGLTGKELLCLLAAGADIICRMGLAITVNPIQTGFHLTSLFGYIVSALLSCRVLGLSEEQTLNACGIAYHQAAGNGQSVKDGALTKRMGPGFAVRAGIMSALLAAKGLTGAKNSLEGEWGLYRVYFHGNYERERLLGGLGKDFETANVSIKPYPCCRGTHASIDAALEMRGRVGSTREVEEILLSTGKANHMLLCSPMERKLRPSNPVDAQFSIPWACAVAFAKGKVRLEHFRDEALRDKEILSITSKIRTAPDPSLSRQKGDEPALITVIKRDGQRDSILVEHPLGGPQRPMPFEAVVEKFKDCLSFSGKEISEDKVDKLIEKVHSLEDVSDAAEIIDLMSLLG